MSEYDIYLNGKGYMLAKDSRGALLPGAAREQIIDPFTQFLSQDEPYTRVPFRFGDGSGLHEYDGSHRYEWGSGCDARSGKLLLAPERVQTGDSWKPMKVSITSSILAELIDSNGSQHGIAERYSMPPGATTLRSVSILVKRNLTVDYSAANPFYVSIHEDDTNKPKEPAMAYKAVSLKSETDPWSPFPDRWRNGDWFWLEVIFDADVVVGTGNTFWVSVFNSQGQHLYWASDLNAPEQVRSTSNGTVWGTAETTDPMLLKIGLKDGANQFDGLIRCFQIFRGTDEIERMYCGTGYRILYWDATWSSGHWWESKTIGAPVLQLLEFDEKLFAACGPDTDMWYSTGIGPGSLAWTQVTSNQANALAVHDNMLWKADYNSVNGSTTGLAAAWGATPVVVGDPGTPVQAMVSHGGKLFCAKPEGIFEISYPDTYPTSGTPTANLLLDFSTERCPRTWMLDWHSGLYFPGLGGVYELKSGILRNLWEDKIDEDAVTVQPLIPPASAPFAAAAPPAPRYSKVRSWSPLYDHGPAAWSAAHATTRGILFARAAPHTEMSELIWFDGRNWYSLRAARGTDAYGAPQMVAEYITACFMQDAGGGRGWMWYNEGLGIARTEWPTWTDNTSDDESVEYEIDGMITTPWFYQPNPSRLMLLNKIGVGSMNLKPSPYTILYIYYRCDDTITWTYMGTQIDTSPYQEVSFPAGTTCRRVQFKIILLTGTDTNTPIVDQVDLLYQVLPEKTTTHQLLVACSGDQSLHEAGVDERTAGEVVADLKSLVGVSSFTYTDLMGADHSVRVTALTVQMMNQHTGPGPEAYDVQAQAILNLLEA